MVILGKDAPTSKMPELQFCAFESKDPYPSFRKFLPELCALLTCAESHFRRFASRPFSPLQK